MEHSQSMYGDVTIRPYRFQSLPTVNRAEMQFFQALSKAFPAEHFTPALISEILLPLEGYIKTQIAWEWTNKEVLLSSEQLERTCLAPTLLVELALLPLEHRVLVEFDPHLISVMVDRALGGQGDVRNASRTLTDVERGVFTFFLLKLLQQFQQLWASELQRELRIGSIVTSLNAIRGSLKENSFYYHQEFRLGITGQVGFVRLFLPEQLVRESLRSVDNNPLPPEFILNRMHRIANTPVVGSVRVGMVDLSEADLAGLEEDDIVLLRECSARRHEEGFLQGEATLQFSQRPQVGLRCSIQDDPSSQHSSVLLEEIISIAEPEAKGVLDRSEYNMDENGQDYPNDYEESEHADEHFGEMAPVLSDVPVPLIVELGRVECRARDVMHLRLGQVMELRRSPYEPLDLVVNGQILGKGELVEIEGQLGVRIIELLK